MSAANENAGDPGGVVASRAAPFPDPVLTALEMTYFTERDVELRAHLVTELFRPPDPWRGWMRQWADKRRAHSAAVRDHLLAAGAPGAELLDAMPHRQPLPTASQVRAGRRLLIRLTFEEQIVAVILERVLGWADSRDRQDLLDSGIHIARHAVDRYRPLVAAALRAQPSRVTEAIADEVASLPLPTGIRTTAVGDAVDPVRAGIYDVRTHHDRTLLPLLRAWGFFGVDTLDAPAEHARDHAADLMRTLDQLAHHCGSTA